MSIFKTALISALLASSTAAMAAPGVSLYGNADFSFAASTSPAVRDHRSHGMSQWMPSSTTNWSILSSSLQLRTGTDVIRLNGRQALSQIRIQATSGNVQIDRVNVRFTDGTVQTMRLRTQLNAEQPLTQLDLQNRNAVDSITIIGHGNRRASYQVLAQGARFERPRPIVNFSGVYTSVYGDVVLQQVGDRIYGDYHGKYGTLQGYVRNGVAVLDWKEVGSSGRATFTIGANGKIEGTWGNGVSTHDAGEWDLFLASR